MKNNGYSDLKIFEHPEKLAALRDGRITAPVYVRVKPINKCNHACSWCVYKGDRKADQRTEEHMAPVPVTMHTDMDEADVMPRIKMLEVLNDFKAMGVKAVTYSGGGEPLLHPNITEFMERTLLNGIALSIITNGQLLTGGRAEALGNAHWVRVSIDYTDAKQMAHTRVVPERMFQGVLDNLANFAAIKNKGCDLGVNFIVHRENHGDLMEFTRTLKKCGVDNVRFSPMWTPDLAGYHAPHAEKVEREIDAIAHELNDLNFAVHSSFDLASEAHGPKRGYTQCPFMQIVPVVGADQKVYACHNKAYDPTGVIGSIKEQSFQQLWFSDEARVVFEGLNPKTDCQHQCANHFKNRIIHNAMAQKPNDPFI